MTVPAFHGTGREAELLRNAIARNCTCNFDDMGARTLTCPPHKMLLEDQRCLDGLLFMRRKAECLKREEFST